MLDTEIEELIRAEERRQTEGLEMIPRSEEHTSELQSQSNLVCRLLLEKKKIKNFHLTTRFLPIVNLRDIFISDDAIDAKSHDADTLSSHATVVSFERNVAMLHLSDPVH